MATGHVSPGDSVDFFHDKKGPSEMVCPNGITENALSITIDTVAPAEAPAGAATLSFKDLTYSVNVKRKEEKVIVDGVSGCVCSCCSFSPRRGSRQRRGAIRKYRSMRRRSSLRGRLRRAVCDGSRHHHLALSI